MSLSLYFDKGSSVLNQFVANPCLMTSWANWRGENCSKRNWDEAKGHKNRDDHFSTADMEEQSCVNEGPGEAKCER